MAVPRSRRGVQAQRSRASPLHSWEAIYKADTTRCKGGQMRIAAILIGDEIHWNHGWQLLPEGGG